MPKTLLSVLHHQQRNEADCLPVCVQMVLFHLNIAAEYEGLLKLMDTRWFGTPFRHVMRVQELGVKVSVEHLALNEIKGYLQQGVPVIACIHTADLGYWSQTVDHVVLVAGVEGTKVLVHDPHLETGPIAIPQVEFELAQLQFDNLCAVISV